VGTDTCPGGRPDGEAGGWRLTGNPDPATLADAAFGLVGTDPRRAHRLAAEAAAAAARACTPGPESRAHRAALATYRRALPRLLDGDPRDEARVRNNPGLLLLYLAAGGGRAGPGSPARAGGAGGGPWSAGRGRGDR
jgi:hypothetical protein